MSNRNETPTLIGGGTLFVVFLVLKLTNTVGWSWWWVTCPLWIGPAIAVAILLAFAVAGFLAMCVLALFALIAD